MPPTRSRSASPTDPEEFGKGAIAGVAGPESANNAGAQTSFIPMLTLGIPANPVMALMIGAMIIQGIVPGPNVATEQPALFWGIIASMWIGNLMLIVLNLPLIGLWVKLLTVPYYVLFPIIMAFCSIGVYSVNSNVYDLFAVAFFGLIGYVLVKLRCEPAPLLLGFVLGPLLEENLRRAMILSRGDPTTFVTRPISALLLAIAAGRAGRRLPARRQEEARGGVRRGELSEPDDERACVASATQARSAFRKLARAPNLDHSKAMNLDRLMRWGRALVSSCRPSTACRHLLPRKRGERRYLQGFRQPPTLLKPISNVPETNRNVAERVPSLRPAIFPPLTGRRCRQAVEGRHKRSKSWAVWIR